MSSYLDTSAICRYYHSEPGSDKVAKLVEALGANSLISWLGMLEAQSAFAMKVRTGEISKPDFLQLCKRFKTDIANRRFLVVRVLRRHFDRAEALIETCGLTQRIRSLDAIHLGVVLALAARGELSTIVTADTAQQAVAQQEGLTVINPLTP